LICLIHSSIILPIIDFWIAELYVSDLSEFHFSGLMAIMLELYSIQNSQWSQAIARSSHSLRRSRIKSQGNRVSNVVIEANGSAHVALCSLTFHGRKYLAAPCRYHAFREARRLFTASLLGRGWSAIKYLSLYMQACVVDCTWHCHAARGKPDHYWLGFETSTMTTVYYGRIKEISSMCLECNRTFHFPLTFNLTNEYRGAPDATDATDFYGTAKQ